MEPIPPVLARYVEGLKRHDVEKIADTVSDDLEFVSAGRTLTKAKFLEMLRAIYAAFPDWSYAHDAPEEKDGVVAIRWRQGGTHTGVLSLPGLDPIPATNRTIRIPEQCFFYTVRDERIVRIRPDPIPGGAPRGILEQIGVKVPPL